MDQTNRDTYSIMTNADGIAFATQKNWRHITDDLSCLYGFAIITSRVSAGAVYFLLMNMSPLDLNSDRKDSRVLAKVTTNEETGETEYYMIELNREESILLEDTPLAFWG